VTIRLVEIRRVSTEEQARDDRSGLDRQAESNRKTAERIGAVLIEPPIVITDVCRENFIDTPEWRTIRTLIADPDVHIVVDMQDRIAGALEGIPIIIECKRTNTQIYHSQGVTDPTTFAGQVLATFTALAAGNELHSIRHRAQGGKESKRREGIFPSSDISLPTGIAYIRTKGERAGRWTYDDKIAVVREVYRLVVEDGIRNWAEVARHAGATSNVTVRNMLTNPIYMGWWIVDEKRQPGATPIKSDGRRKDRKKIKRAPEEVIRHQVFRPKGGPQDPTDPREEAVVDEGTWDLVQSIVESKREAFYKPREPKGNTRFTYTGRIWCAECGEAIWSRTKPKVGRAAGRRDWYACKSTQRGGGRSCPTKYLKRETVNDALDRLFSTVFANEQFISALISQGLDADRQDFSDQITAASKALKKVEDQRSRLLDLYMDGSWERAELDARRGKLDAVRDKAVRELKRLQRAQAMADKTMVLEGLREVLLALSEYEFWTPKQKRELLAKFFPRIDVSKKGVERIRVALPAVRLVDGREVTTVQELPITANVGMTWTELLPAPEPNDLGLVPKALYTRADIKQVLGLTDAQFVGRLESGEIPPPVGRRWNHKAWTEEQVREMVRAAKAVEQPAEFGLPTKALYTTGDLCRVLGVSWGRIRWSIRAGELPDSQQRDANGHRIWTAEEMRAAIKAFASLKQQPVTDS
jgi:DNA invertase Pin-like site-specific DNA recombinase